MINKKRGIFVLVLAVLTLLLMISVHAQTQGCYVYEGASEDLYCQDLTDEIVQTDCAQHDGCDMNTHFLSNVACSSQSVCKQIVCSIDCLVHPAGICSKLGGQEVPADKKVEMCSPGCCIIAGKSCNYPVQKAQCLQNAKFFGLNTYSNFIIEDMDKSKCLALPECQIGVRGNGIIKGKVLDQKNKPIKNAKFKLVGRGDLTQTSATDGSYTIDNLPTNVDLVIEVSVADYAPLTKSVNLKPGETLSNVDFILTEAKGQLTIQGTVTDVNNNPLQGANIIFIGPVRGTATTGNDGKYTFKGTPGNYRISVTRIGYSISQKDVEIKTAQTINFVLSSTKFAGIKGIIYKDTERNGKIDSNDEKIYGAKIYVDGLFKGYSRYPDGNYAVPLTITEKKTVKITATFQDAKGKVYEVGVEPGKESTQNILLTDYVGACTNTEISVAKETFVVKNVPGKKELKISWKKPCFEATGYAIVRYEGENKGPAKTFDSKVSSYVDDMVEWGKTYKYEIVVLFDKGRKSEPTESDQINVGSEMCEGKYTNGKWETFCYNDISDTQINERKFVWTCTNENKLTSTNCDALGKNYFCSPSTDTTAQCKSDEMCRLDSNPFGLYSSLNQCYGTSNPNLGTGNFCTYDYTNSIVDSCKSCTQIKSCFDYVSEEACKINSCLGTECVWVGSAGNPSGINYDILPNAISMMASIETGRGFCAPKDYDKDDQCSLCSSGATMFENYYCTADICSTLGACYSQNDLAKCNSCGENPTIKSNCYSYLTQLECVGNSSVKFDEKGLFSLSDDSCSWNRCSWIGTKDAGSCVKDGNADKKDDCQEFVNIGERNLCKIDTEPPRTELKSDSTLVITMSNTNLTFVGDDEFHKFIGSRTVLKKLTYCVTPGDSQEICNDYITKEYNDKTSKEELIVNLLEHPTFKKKTPNGETYRIYFASEDRFYNKEDRKEALIFVDVVPPSFKINESHNTSVDITNFNFLLKDLDESAKCSFKLTPVFPRANPKIYEVDFDKPKAVTFENMKGALFEIEVNCVDKQGNEFNKIEKYAPDLSQTITVIEPKKVIKKSNVSFKIKTDIGASCSLILTETGQKIVDFEVTDTDAKEHSTRTLTGFLERSYVGVYKIVCEELLSKKLHEEFLDFSIDYTSPDTEILLTEGSREFKPRGEDWEEYFIRSANVQLTCIEDGFACDKIYYCLGDNCQIIGKNYKEYTNSFSINDTTKVCYYSTDFGKTVVLKPTCGTVKIEGFGVTLENPEPFIYDGDIWGITGSKEFDLVFYTKIPTEECRFDFLQNFDFGTVPKYKILKKNAAGKYIINNFPASVFAPFKDPGVIDLYIKCIDGDGEIAPEEMFKFEWDPTQPKIISVKADPNEMFEGIKTQFFVNTNKKTVCKYSDNSLGQGSKDFQTMEYSFPGEEYNFLSLNHQDTFSINFIGSKKEYSINALCMNGAGNLSNLANFNFTVDYSVAGNIMSVKPSGYLNAQEVEIEILTNKNAVCNLWRNESKDAFQGAGTTRHIFPMSNLTETEYNFRAQCFVGGRLVESPVQFVIDKTPPKITFIDDGTYSCGNLYLSVMVYTDEQNVSSYLYEVYEIGNNNKNDMRVKVLNGTAGKTLPLKIPTQNLKEGYNYEVEVIAIDFAGNIGLPEKSNGFIITNYNLTECVNDTKQPLIDFVTNETCTALFTEIRCNDEIGCSNIMYGKSSNEDDCNATNVYSGEKIKLLKTSWICYQAKDNNGNNISGKKLLVFSDTDGDGVSNSCDQCAGTEAGKVPDENGCSDVQTTDEQKSLDTDLDLLPDAWEKQFNSETCKLDYTLKDSDGNGVDDTQEDYDQDGFTNYDEYAGLTNPCVADEKAQVEDLVTKPSNVTQEDVLREPITKKPEEKTKLLPWILLIIGFLMTVGGVGYLIYFYKYAAPPVQSTISGTSFDAKPTVQKIQPKGPDKFVEWRKKRLEKKKEEKRSKLFSEFGQESVEIPHVDESLSKKVPHLKKLEELAKKYQENKEQIKPGLKTEEKSVFAQLENIAKKTDKKKIEDVVSKKEAKDIFSKLKDISKKRKENEE